MNNLENWEKTISSKFSEHQFPFDEGNWDKAEQMIEAKETKRKRIKWISIYSLGIVTGALIMFATMKLFLASPVQTNQLTENSKTKISKELGVRSSEKNPSPTNSVSSQSTTNSTGENSNSDNSQHQNSGSHHSNQALYQNTTSENNPNRVSTSHANSVEPISYSNAGAISSEDMTSDKGQVTGENKIANEAPTENQFEEIKNPIADSFPSAEKSSLVQFPVPTDSLWIAKAIVPVKKDSIIYPYNTFSVEAGTNYILGWKNLNGTEARGINPVGGFTFTHAFNARWALVIGARYERVGYLNMSYKHVTDSLPNFGLNNTSTVITPTTLHYFSFPLKVERTFNAKNTFGIGATFSYLFNTTSRVEIWNETDGDQTEAAAPRTQYGYLNGFNNLDAALNFSYRRQFSSKFGLQFEGTYGLFDVKSNSSFAIPENKSEHIFGMRLMFTYRLF